MGLTRRELLRLGAVTLLEACARPFERAARSMDQVLADQVAREREACFRALEYPGALPPGFEWIRTAENIHVISAASFPDSFATVIYVDDTHTPDAMQDISRFLLQAQARGIRTVGLEGIVGPIDETRRAEMLRKIAELDLEKRKLSVKCKGILPMNLQNLVDWFGTGVDFTDLPEYTSPGRGYLAYLPTNLSMKLSGIDDMTDYSAVTLSSKYHHIQRIVEHLRCLEVATEKTLKECALEYTSPDSGKHQKILAGKTKIGALIEHFVRVQESIGLKIKIATPAEMKELNRVRGHKAAENFTYLLRDSNEKAGVLIFGLKHATEVRDTLTRQRISHIEIRSGNGSCEVP